MQQQESHWCRLFPFPCLQRRREYTGGEAKKDFFFSPWAQSKKGPNPKVDPGHPPALNQQIKLKLQLRRALVMKKWRENGKLPWQRIKKNFISYQRFFQAWKMGKVEERSCTDKCVNFNDAVLSVTARYSQLQHKIHADYQRVGVFARTSLSCDWLPNAKNRKYNKQAARSGREEEDTRIGLYRFRFFYSYSLYYLSTYMVAARQNMRSVDACIFTCISEWKHLT